MGYASHEGKAFAIDLLLQWADHKTPGCGPDTELVFLDLGAGAGSWMEAIRPWFLKSKWIAVEVWQPYVDQFCLPERYHLVTTGDIRDMRFPIVDVVILGDVLEHMTKEEARKVWDSAIASARVGVFMSTPIIEYHQGHVHGNPYQEHVITDWDVESIKADLPGIDVYEQGETCGIFFARGTAEEAFVPEVVRAGE